MNTAELAKLLRALYAENDGRLKARFDRSLPFQDGLFDRWERADRLGFAKGASVYGSALIFGDVRVGEQTWIGPYTILNGSAGLLSIGEYCSISSGVHIYTHDTVQWALSGGLAAKKAGPVTIGDRVYIGPQSIVSLGVTVGAQSVVAAQSFVNKDVAPRTIVAGKARASTTSDARCSTTGRACTNTSTVMSFVSSSKSTLQGKENRRLLIWSLLNVEAFLERYLA